MRTPREGPDPLLRSPYLRARTLGVRPVRLDALSDAERAPQRPADRARAHSTAGSRRSRSEPRPLWDVARKHHSQTGLKPGATGRWSRCDVRRREKWPQGGPRCSVNRELGPPWGPFFLLLRVGCPLCPRGVFDRRSRRGSLLPERPFGGRKTRSRGPKELFLDWICACGMSEELFRGRNRSCGMSEELFGAWNRSCGMSEELFGAWNRSCGTSEELLRGPEQVLWWVGGRFREIFSLCGWVWVGSRPCSRLC